jgi:hypothetical protein
MNDFELTVIKRGETVHIVITPNQRFSNDRIKHVARELLFQILDAFELLFPDPPTETSPDGTN